MRELPDEVLIALLEDHFIAVEIIDYHREGRVRDTKNLMGLIAKGMAWGIGDHGPELLAPHEIED